MTARDVQARRSRAVIDRPYSSGEGRIRDRKCRLFRIDATRVAVTASTSMRRLMRVNRLKRKGVMLAIAAIGIAGILIHSDSDWAAVPVTGTAQLVSVQSFPEGASCTWENPSTVPL